MERNASTRSELIALEVGQSTIFPAEMVTSLRTTASALGLQYDRKYRTKADRVARTITVTRVK